MKVNLVTRAERNKSRTNFQIETEIIWMYCWIYIYITLLHLSLTYKRLIQVEQKQCVKEPTIFTICNARFTTRLKKSVFSV